MRSVSQIYSEAVATRNSYLQLTELDSGRSNCKLSILNALTYVVSVAIHTYEAILDVFQVKIAELLNGRINGTPDWYAAMAKRFQYNPALSKGDPLSFNEETLKVEYDEVRPGRRIVEKSAWEHDENEQAIVLKVAKASSESEKRNGIPCKPLEAAEMTEFKKYVQQIRFVGATIYCQSLPGDILSIVADENSPIFYDDRYVTASQALSSIQKALVEFVSSVPFNYTLYYQDIVDVLQKTENVSYVYKDIKAYVAQFDEAGGEYLQPVELSNRMGLKSGYMRVVDQSGALTINASRITLVPASMINQYDLR